jgi:hypothetical protein
MSFSEQLPSKQWAVLRCRGEKFAEVWFKPEGEPFGLTFRIPQQSFQAAGAGQGLTTANLLKAVGIAAEEVESWRHGDCTHLGMSGGNPEFRNPLSPPPPDVAQLDIHVSLKRPEQSVAGGEDGSPAPLPPPSASGESQAAEVTEKVTAETSSLKWQDLVGRWNTILGLETSIDTLRLTMEGVRAELEALWKKPLTSEEKLHARRDDVARWNKEKRRVHFVLPKLREFVHRATWAVGTPERKKLDEVFEEDVEPALTIAQMIKVGDELDSLLKERQVLSAQGVTVHQECKSIAANIQEALRTLQSNAAANKDKKRREKSGSKFFKDVRRASGLN